jgi:ketosteroid isomerase-like protein
MEGSMRPERRWAGFSREQKPGSSATERITWGPDSASVATGEGAVTAETPKEVVARFYKAVADRDLEAAGACFHEQATWVLPGVSPIAGEHRGWGSIRDDFLARLGPLSDGTFHAELLDVAVGERFVVAVQRATAHRERKRLDVTACQLMSIEDGKIVSVRGHYSDQQALDDFWS